MSTPPGNELVAWQPIDVRSDPFEVELLGDPADIVDALGDLLALAQRPAWHQDAACRGEGPEPWFPSRGVNAEHARAVCDECPVRQECLEAGLYEPAGLWGGTSERQRRQIRKNPQRHAA